MADGSLTIDLDEETAALLDAAAKAAGEAPEAFVRRVIADVLRDAHWAPAIASLAEYDRTGESYALEEVFAELRDRVAAHRAAGG